MTDQVKFVASAKRVIDAEAAALTTLSTSLGPSFGEAVALLLNAKGRVIVSGMGKSGHIARDRNSRGDPKSLALSVRVR